MLKILVSILFVAAIMACSSGESSMRYLDTPAVVQALDGYDLTDEEEKFYAMIFASDGRGYQIMPGPYGLEIYVYESGSLMKKGLDVLEELSKTMGGGGIVRTEGNVLLILNRSGGPTPVESDMDSLISDLRNAS